ncbi:amylo-alpha-1,6-glucosidase [Methanococcoides sp. LMO-2]|uniref:Amylo-alpha-1,6-glucosidase n=1 Tax=Methanococcoides cohabitans TaxID=3136559 RepID=A0ABU9KRV5_9EURY
MLPSPPYNDEFDHEAAISREWLITNGTGGYASSTVIGENSRKYHGLLVASANPPVDRRVLLSSLDEELIIEGEVFRLAVHSYPDTLYPSGFQYLERFSAFPLPTFEYRVGNVKLIKTVFMVHGTNTTVVRYRIFNTARQDIVLRILPLVANRGFHELRKAEDASFTEVSIDTGADVGSNLVDDDVLLQLRSNMKFKRDSHWYYNFQYEMERERGEAYQEDLYNPGYFEEHIVDNVCEFYVVASDDLPDEMESEHILDPALALELVNFEYEKELSRQKDLLDKYSFNDDLAKKLSVAADSFIVQRRSTDSHSIIAGYHWFADWGRDAMISLPGLTLVTGRFSDAKEILRTFSENCSDGLIPNRFSDDGISAPDYNTVDASLWFIHSVGRYYSYTKDLRTVREMWKTVVSIIHNYKNGTSYGIRMDDDGLIEHEGQLTWMDVKIGDQEITPRAGKACEINALWYNALCTAIRLGELIGEETAEYLEIAELVKSNFIGVFWNPEDRCLYDCVSVNEDGTVTNDASVRPNQIFAVSLPYTMLDTDKERLVVEKVKVDLLTPYGLRSLSPNDNRYVGMYGGDHNSRDRAYHNGMVWAWLMGPFITAYVKVNGNSLLSLEYCRQLLSDLECHLDEAGIGSISEIFDGDSPHRPRGCIAQAWSVAEILRAYIEDINS